MKIGLIQQQATRNKENNIAPGLKALEKTVSHGAKLIAFPKLVFDSLLPQCPASSQSLNSAETIRELMTEILCRKAKQFGVVVVLNLFEKEGDVRYGSSPVTDANGEIVGKTRMIHIVEAPEFHEIASVECSRI